MVTTQLAQQLALLARRAPMLRWAESAVDVMSTAPPLAPALEARVFLEDAMWFLRRGERHPQMSDQDWAALKPVAERLVNTREVDPEVLGLF